MSIAAPILFLLLGLIVLAGFIVILVLVLVAMRRRITKKPPQNTNEDQIVTYPWEEAGRRIESDDPKFDELA